MYTYNALVTSVFDGDTFRADVDLGFGIWKRNESFRLWGLDAPEIAGDKSGKGKAARDALRALILNKEVTITTKVDRQEKYGRYLAKVTVIQGEKEVDVNLYMIEVGYAVSRFY